MEVVVMSETIALDQRQRAALEPQDGRSDPGPFAGYKGGEEMPLPAFAAIVALYSAALAGLLVGLKRRDRPERIGLGDLLLLGVATHKLGRRIPHDWVTSPFRAAFTEYQGTSGAGEVKESARGTGMQRALGDLFT
jgi:hypothetical protein